MMFKNTENFYHFQKTTSLKINIKRIKKYSFIMDYPHTNERNFIIMLSRMR